MRADLIALAGAVLAIDCAPLGSSRPCKRSGVPTDITMISMRETNTVPRWGAPRARADNMGLAQHHNTRARGRPT